MLLAVVMAWPRVASGAPAKRSVSEVRAAEAVKAYQEGVRWEHKGEREKAEHYYRAAAEANAAAFAAVERSSANSTIRRTRYADRTIKAYAAARQVFDNPTLRTSAGEWCARWAADPEAAKLEIFASLQQECKQWPVSPPLPAREPPPVVNPQPPVPKPEPDPGERGSEGSTPPGGEPVPKAAPVGEGAVQGPVPAASVDKKHPADRIRGGLTSAGGVALGVGGISLLVSLVGAVRQAAVERDYLGDGCAEIDQPHCAGLFAQGERIERMTAATLVMGTIFAGTGAILLAIAMRRKPSKVAVAPGMGPQYVGLGLQGRF